MAGVTLSQIVKEALNEIRSRHLMLTPENYSEIFNEISNKYGFTTQESEKIQKYIARLSDEYKKQAYSINIKTSDELIAFMTSRLNIGASQLNKVVEQDDELSKSYNALTKRILQAVCILHNKDAKDLAERCINELSRRCETKNIDLMRENWFDFISSYNDDFLKFLKYYGVRNFDDLRTMSNQLENYLNIEDEASGITKVAELVISMLTPSFSKELESEISEIKDSLKKNPASINTHDIQDMIKRTLARRIEVDRAEITEKIGTINELLENINDKILSLADSSSLSSVKMQNIKSDLNNINLNTKDFQSIKDTLIEVANVLEIETRELGIQMNNNQETITHLQNKIKILEQELEAAKLESKEDFLTKTATKRALMEELKRIEEAYKRYGTDYSLCFLDIDHFKKINDTYGHDAGDVILATVAKIIRKYSRKIDFVGRYGGEEFIILLPNTTLKEAVKFADKLRSIIENFKFVYKDERIGVTLSSGVATRGVNTSDTMTLENADKMLYAAKDGGRNQVMPKIIEKK